MRLAGRLTGGTWAGRFRGKGEKRPFWSSPCVPCQDLFWSRLIVCTRLCVPQGLFPGGDPWEAAVSSLLHVWSWSFPLLLWELHMDGWAGETADKPFCCACQRGKQQGCLAVQSTCCKLQKGARSLTVIRKEAEPLREQLNWLPAVSKRMAFLKGKRSSGSSLGLIWQRVGEWYPLGVLEEMGS